MKINPIRSAVIIAIGSTMLAGCGGGSSGTTGSTSAAGTTTIMGQVIDGPIAGADLCVYVNGNIVKDSSGKDVCATTDANGFYSVDIPDSSVTDSDFVNLIATKGSTIKLASSAGTVAQIKSAAGSGTATTKTLPQAKVTNQTTAEFAVADLDGNGIVDAQEEQSFDPNSAANQKKIGTISTLVKACIDDNQCGSTAGKVRGSDDTLQMSENAESALDNNQTMKDGSDPSTDADNYLKNSLTPQVAGHTFFIEDNSGPNILTLDNGTNQSATLVGYNTGTQKTSYETGTWSLDTTTTPQTLNVTAGTTTLDMSILGSSDNNGLYVSIGGQASTLAQAGTFATTDVSGKTMTFDNNNGSMVFNADGSGTDTTASCAQSTGGAAFTWQIDATGALVADETGSCTGEMLYVYPLEKEDYGRWKIAGYSIVPSTNTVTSVTYGEVGLN